MNNMYWMAEQSKNVDKQYKLGDDLNTLVSKDETNHIYFYSGVGPKSSLELNKILQMKANELLSINTKYNITEKPKIYLHISSFGGSLFAGISSMDTIFSIRKDVDIITIAEGGVASAGTFISIAGTKRLMTANSFILIHQLASTYSGKYRELKDDMENSEELMDMIRTVYGKYTKVPSEELDKILDRDLWLNSKKCLAYNLVDEII
ncbi:MAG: ATP-dependent Clp protease proteolytic subunit [Nanoarchaeota archaeon]